MNRDHYVQAAYMGLWSVNGKNDRDGAVYLQDIAQESNRWVGPTAIDRHLVERGFDRIPEASVQVLRRWLGRENINSASWDSNIVHPIEQSGYVALSQLATEFRERRVSMTPDLRDWILLQLLRTPGSRELLSDSSRLVRSQSLDLPARSDHDFEILESGNRAGLLFIMFQNGVTENHDLSLLASRLESRIWSVRRVQADGSIIGSDNPILLLRHSADREGDRRCFVVPLGPKRILYGAPQGEKPQRVDQNVVATINTLLKKNARRWIFRSSGVPPFKHVGTLLPEEAP